jgi:hypothetical protein
MPSGQGADVTANVLDRIGGGRDSRHGWDGKLVDTDSRPILRFAHADF